MKKLALSDEILLSVEKPARYIGNEINAYNKDKSKAATSIAMCFPDVYEIGMSHLGIQILYDMFNQREDIYCDRVYSPWVDLDRIMREKQIPLFCVESQEPVRTFDFLAITLQYEMCYTNILQILDLSHIPLHSTERGEDDPIVIGGGPCAYNPEPIAPFFDLFYIGEGETQYYHLIDLYQKNRANGGSRHDFLELAAEVPGIYVPQFYDVTYHEDGTIASFQKNNPRAQDKIRKELVTEVSETFYPRHPLASYIKVTQDRVVLEIQRGCIRGCRFCQAGMVYRPVRERSLEFLKDLALEMLRSTGQEEITLSSLSSSDYSQLPELVNFLIDTCRREHINISLPSLRIDAFSLDVMSKVQDIKKSSLTFAPEAGTQRMRNVINKGLTEEVILKGAGMAFEGGWNRVKLYFMLGLPTETEEDMVGIAELAEKIAERYYEIPKKQRNGRVNITSSTSFFVPKPFTPFQWAPMLEREEYMSRARIVNHAMKAQLNHKSLSYHWHEADVTVLEGVFARGDRRVAEVIETAYQRGCIYDAWSEYFHYDVWMECFAQCGLTTAFYNTRVRDLDEILPWDFLDVGVTKQFLKREWANAQAESVTPNCRAKCSGCGVARFGCGVCLEEKGAKA